MELDDLKNAWAQQAALLESNSSLTALLQRGAATQHARSALERLARSLTVELVFLFGTIVALGSFAADRIAQPSTAICAALLGVYGLAIAQGEIRQLVALRAIGMDEAVTGLQRKLERIRLLRLRTTKWALLFAPIMWVPMLAVFGALVFGIDVFARLSPIYITANLLFGLATIPLSVLVAHRLAANPGASAVLRQFAHVVTGADLRAATDYLAGVETFEAA